MLKKNHALLALAAAGILAACDEADGPLSPENQESSVYDGPELVTAEPNAGAVLEEGTGVFTYDQVIYFACVGEDVRSIIHAPYTYRVVESPSGNNVYVELWDTDAVTGTLIGQTSGIVWSRINNVSPLVQRNTGGGSGMLHYTFKGDFESDVGPYLKVQQVFHMSWNASGELTADFSKSRCVQA